MFVHVLLQTELDGLIEQIDKLTRGNATQETVIRKLDEELESLRSLLDISRVHQIHLKS